MPLYVFNGTNTSFTDLFNTVMSFEGNMGVGR